VACHAVVRSCHKCVRMLFHARPTSQTATHVWPALVPKGVKITCQYRTPLGTSATPPHAHCTRSNMVKAPSLPTELDALTGLYTQAMHPGNASIQGVCFCVAVQREYSQTGQLPSIILVPTNTALTSYLSAISAPAAGAAGSGGVSGGSGSTQGLTLHQLVDQFGNNTPGSVTLLRRHCEYG
jgi:hypothetical protein